MSKKNVGCVSTLYSLWSIWNCIDLSYQCECMMTCGADTSKSTKKSSNLSEQSETITSLGGPVTVVIMILMEFLSAIGDGCHHDAVFAYVTTMLLMGGMYWLINPQLIIREEQF